jgi:hypothetical protein
MNTIGRNDLCHCGSGKKYKKCHLSQDEVKEHKVLEKAMFQPRPDQMEKKKQTHEHEHSSGKGWLKSMAGKMGIGRQAGQRKTPSGPSGG